MSKYIWGISGTYYEIIRKTNKWITIITIIHDKEKDYANIYYDHMKFDKSRTLMTLAVIERGHIEGFMMVLWLN